MISLKEKEVMIITKEELKQVDELRQETKTRQAGLYQKKTKIYSRPPAKFNPNEYSLEQWVALGLTSKQAGVVLKFTSRGVYNIADVERIFVIPHELMTLMKDSLVFPERKYKNEYSTKSTSLKKEIKPININNAPIEELMEMPGVGTYIAERIIAYRERLGGFIAKEQLMDIRKIDLELFNKLEGYVLVDKQLIKPLNVNKASAEELKNHPYFNWSIANSIVKMRAQRGGSFKSLDELLDSALIDRELFEKIKPYLSL
jgi:competence ComEA-like helix-hairpin-helix protein